MAILLAEDGSILFQLTLVAKR